MQLLRSAWWVAFMGQMVSIQLLAQVALSQGSYEQTFDSLSMTGSPAWADNVTLPGWYAGHGGGPMLTYRTGTGSTSTGGLYSYGSSGSAERALGSLATESLGLLVFGVRFVNDTRHALGNFAVSMAGEQWRTASLSPQSLSVSYRANSGALTDLDPGGVLAWTAVEALGFRSPELSSTAGARDGNDAGHRAWLADVPLTGLVLDPGQELMLRWADANDAGSDHGLAIDDLQVSFSAVPEPGEYSMVASLALLALLVRRWRCSAPAT